VILTLETFWLKSGFFLKKYWISGVYAPIFGVTRMALPVSPT
jgi:hypothetical protein